MARSKKKRGRPTSMTKAKREAKQARSRETVDVVLTGAAFVLGEYGYGRATTDRIAERAGVSVGSIYQYFANKDEIFAVLFEREGQKMLDALDRIVADGTSSGRERIRAYLAAGATQELLTAKVFQELENVPGFEVKIAAFFEKVIHLTMDFIFTEQPSLEAGRVRTLAELLVTTAGGLGRALRDAPNDELLDAFIEMTGTYILGSQIM